MIEIIAKETALTRLHIRKVFTWLRSFFISSSNALTFLSLLPQNTPPDIDLQLLLY